jgi:hypothetical protein
MEGFSFVTPVTGLNRPNTGKEGDDDDDDVNTFYKRVLNSIFKDIAAINYITVQHKKRFIPVNFDGSCCVGIFTKHNYTLASRHMPYERPEP